MTLMLASIRPSDVVITADGRSTTRTNGRVAGVDDHFQKLYPIPDHPVVIGNLGENDLDGKPLGEFLGEFFGQLNTGNHTIEQIADELRKFAHPAIRRRLKSVKAPEVRCGFWVAGFGSKEEHPRLVENFWKWKDPVLSCDEHQYVPISIVEGGDGQKQIHPADWHVEKDKSVEQVREYHKTMMDEALKARMEFNPVGGHVHELVITRSQWQWTQPPMPKELAAPSTRPTSGPT